jgi:hypothetical protein
MKEAQLKITSGSGVKVDPSLLPEHEMNILARETIRRRKDIFSNRA